MSNVHGDIKVIGNREPIEHRVCYFTGRRELGNPDAMYATATEFEPGIIHVRIDDGSNDAFWLEFTLILSNGNDLDSLIDFEPASPIMPTECEGATS